jgi:hypothetical protein
MGEVRIVYRRLLWPSRPQDPIVLALNPPRRTVLDFVIERFACMLSSRLADRRS